MGPSAEMAGSSRLSLGGESSGVAAGVWGIGDLFGATTGSRVGLSGGAPRKNSGRDPPEQEAFSRPPALLTGEGEEMSVASLTAVGIRWSRMAPPPPEEASVGDELDEEKDELAQGTGRALRGETATGAAEMCDAETMGIGRGKLDEGTTPDSRRLSKEGARYSERRRDLFGLRVAR